MESFIERTYRRSGKRYTLVVYGWVAIVAFSTGFISLMAGVPYLGVDWQEFWQVAPVVLAVEVASLVVVSVMSYRRFGAMVAWVRGERGEDLAVSAWVAVVTEMAPFVVRAVIVFSVVSIPADIVAAHAFDLPWYGAIVIAFGVEITIIVGALLDYVGIELLCRPMLREIAGYLPPSFEPPRPSPTLRARVVAVMTVTSLYGAFLGSALGGTPFSPVTKLAVGLSFVIVLSCTLVYFVASLLSSAVVTPVNELVTGVRQVREGALDVRVPVLAADEVGFLVRNFNEMTAGLAEREVLRAAMGMYIDPHVADRFLAEGTELAGEEVDASVMFVDIRDFTSLAEAQQPHETVSTLNDFFGAVVPVINSCGGHANKFLGDGLLAVFGAPERHSDHADRALAAARAILAAVEERYAGRIRVGIGVNSGAVIVGSVGGGGRLEFTFIGDVVNVAKRVEQLTKDFGDPILLTDATRQRLKRPDHDLAARGEIVVRGKSGPLAVHALAAALSS